MVCLVYRAYERQACYSMASRHTLINKRWFFMSGVGVLFFARLASRLKPQCFKSESVSSVMHLHTTDYLSEIDRCHLV